MRRVIRVIGERLDQFAVGHAPDAHRGIVRPVAAAGEETAVGTEGDFVLMS